MQYIENMGLRGTFAPAVRPQPAAVSIAARQSTREPVAQRTATARPPADARAA
jgi:hypothetical protein